MGRYYLLDTKSFAKDKANDNLAQGKSKSDSVISAWSQTRPWRRDGFMPAATSHIESIVTKACQHPSRSDIVCRHSRDVVTTDCCHFVPNNDCCIDLSDGSRSGSFHFCSSNTTMKTTNQGQLNVKSQPITSFSFGHCLADDDITSPRSLGCSCSVVSSGIAESQCLSPLETPRYLNTC